MCSTVTVSSWVTGSFPAASVVDSAATGVSYTETSDPMQAATRTAPTAKHVALVGFALLQASSCHLPVASSSGVEIHAR
jgi:hypothetical protein